MQARQLQASRGWAWIVEGYRIFRRNPPLVTFLVFSYWFILAAINVFPLIGQVAASLSMPALSVGIANGCRAIERGESAAFELVFSGFRRNLRALVRLGAIYLVATLAIFGLSTLVDGGLLLNAMGKGQEVLVETMKDPRAIAALQALLIMLMPLVMAYWFAPLLAAWANVPAAKSLFFSFFACLRNWKPFLVYGLAVMMISAVLPGMLLGAVASLSEGTITAASIAIFLALLFVFVPTLFASFYVSARDIFVDFGQPEEPRVGD